MQSSKQDPILSTDRQKQKEMIRPYRKYQFQLIFLLIIITIQIFILISLNKSLSFYIRESKILSEKLFTEQSLTNTLSSLNDHLQVNYEYLYNLDTIPNIDIIQSIDELTMINNFISKNSNISLELCYKASVDGDRAQIFREKCHGYSPLLILVESANGYRFGGYTTQSFLIGENKSHKDEFAFIFSLDTKKKYKVTKPEKAISDYDRMFPLFGEGDIYITDYCLHNATSLTQFPMSYEEDRNAPMDYVLNGGFYQFLVKELEIMVVYSDYK